MVVNMKCKQKLCNRTKNIETSGNCSICENVMLECFKEFDKQKKPVTKKVEVDFDLMVKVQEQLSRGVLVEQEIVNNLILGGVINILHQHDTIEEVESRIKVVEQISMTDKIRIEALENWTLKQAEDIKELTERLTFVTKNTIIDDVDELKGKVDILEGSMKILTSGTKGEDGGVSDQCKDFPTHVTQNLQDLLAWKHTW